MTQIYDDLNDFSLFNTQPVHNVSMSYLFCPTQDIKRLLLSSYLDN